MPIQKVKISKAEKFISKIGTAILDKMGHKYDTLPELKAQKLFKEDGCQNSEKALKDFSGLVFISSVISVFIGCMIFIASKDIIAAIYIVAATGSMPAMKILKMKNRAKEKRIKMSAALPDVLAAFVILLDAGISVQDALKSIVNAAPEESPLHDELRKTFGKIRLGMSETAAYAELSQRCPLSEISTFASLIIQNSVKGSDNISGALRVLTERARESRRNIALKCGEEAKTKCLLPQTMIFLAILCVMGYPAFCALTEII